MYLHWNKRALKIFLTRLQTFIVYIEEFSLPFNNCTDRQLQYFVCIFTHFIYGYLKRMRDVTLQKEKNYFLCVIYGPWMKRILLGKIRIIHYLRTRMKQQMNHLILWSIHTKKILLMNIFYRTCSHITQKYKWMQSTYALSKWNRWHTASWSLEVKMLFI